MDIDVDGSACGPGNDKNEKDRDMFWNYLNVRICSYGWQFNVIFLRGLNARVRFITSPSLFNGIMNGLFREVNVWALGRG